MDSNPPRRIHAFVSGRVQGVFFRQSTQEEAARLGLTGWVRNLHDGRVELEAQGEADAVGDLLLWCNQGPEAAQVKSLNFEDMAPVEGESSFDVQRE